MRILHVITSLRTGGAEKLMVDLLPRISQSGNTVDLCVFDGIRTPFYEELEAKGIRIISLRIGGSVYDIRNIFALIPLLKNYDIVHTHNTASQLFVAIANWFVRKPKLITTEHNTTNRRRGKWYLKWGDKWMYRQYRRIICISNQAERNLVEYIGSSTKILTIFNGIDVERFALAKPFPKEDAKKIVVTMVAAFRAQKDQKTLIKAFDLLPENYLLQLVGDGELRKEVAFFASQYKCADRIIFMGNRNDVPEILKGSDVLVLSSHYEGLSLSSLESMASGTPFIASDVDGLHEIVDGYGLLFLHEDEKELANLIIRLSEDKGLSDCVSVKCVERARQFDIEVMANKYMSVYTELC